MVYLRFVRILFSFYSLFYSTSSILSYTFAVKNLFNTNFKYNEKILLRIINHTAFELYNCNVSQQLSFLQQQLQGKQFVAVGEAGLDKLAEASMELQLAVFKEQVKLSEKLGLPLIIHCVKAMEELLAVKKESRPQQPWIWHGFRGKPEQAVQLLKKGFYLSFGEYYPDETMQIVPDERLFLETDDSLLDIEDILCQAARVRGVEVEALREVIRRNIQNVFFKA